MNTLIALSALGVAIMGSCTQEMRRLKKPEIEGLTPDQVIFHNYRYDNRATTYLRVSAEMGYLNRSLSGGSAALLREVAVIEWSSGRTEQEWVTFEHFRSGEDGQLEIISSEDAGLQALGPGDVLWHHTFFAAKSGPNFAPFEDFLGSLVVGEVIRTSFQGTFTHRKGTETVIVDCHVAVTETFINDLRGRGWAAPACSEEQEFSLLMRPHR